MSIPDDVDPDLLISRLAGPLTPDARQAFRRAAEDALARVPCQGEGAVYRAVAPLQRAYFDPPSDGRASWDIGRDHARANSPPRRCSSTAATCVSRNGSRLVG